jgi:hypothetical protein
LPQSERSGAASRNESFGIWRGGAVVQEEEWRISNEASAAHFFIAGSARIVFMYRREGRRP